MQVVNQSEGLRRTIGLSGTVAIVVGGVIGMGIFVLIGPMAALAGEALWLAIFIAVILSMVSALPLIQLASALPRAGGGYFFVSRMFSPYLGTLTSNWGVLGGAFSSAMVAKGLASYSLPQVGIDVSPDIGGAVIILLLYVVYRFGLRLASQLQVALVLQLLLALGVYIVYGAVHSGIALSFDMPGGGGNFFMAVVLAYSLSIGAQVLAEIGEEVRDAKRNIPLALLIGGSIILVAYILVGGVFLRTIPYDYEVYQGMGAPLATSAAVFTGPLGMLFINIAAISAGLTSLNAAASSLPREFFAQARDRILPAWFSRIHGSTGTPMNAVTAYCMLAAVLTCLPLTVDFCGYMVAVGLMMLSIPISAAALRLHVKFPARYKDAYLHFPFLILVACVVVAVLCSGGFILLIAFEAPWVLLLYGIWTVVVSVVYAIRKRKMIEKGVDFTVLAKTIPGQDE